MDGLILLREASAAGLTVRADGSRLLIRGPRRAEPLAQQLIAHKAAVLAALTATVPPAGQELGHSLTADEVEAFVERLAIATVDGRLSEEEAVRLGWEQIQVQRRTARPPMTTCLAAPSPRPQPVEVPSLPRRACGGPARVGSAGQARPR